MQRQSASTVKNKKIRENYEKKIILLWGEKIVKGKKIMQLSKGR